MAGNLTLNDLQTIWNLDQNKLRASVRRWAPPPDLVILLLPFTSKVDVRMSPFLPHYRIPEWWWVNKVIVGALLKCFSPLIADCVLTPTL